MKRAISAIFSFSNLIKNNKNMKDKFIKMRPLLVLLAGGVISLAYSSAYADYSSCNSKCIYDHGQAYGSCMTGCIGDPAQYKGDYGLMSAKKNQCSDKCSPVAPVGACTEQCVAAEQTAPSSTSTKKEEPTKSSSVKELSNEEVLASMITRNESSKCGDVKGKLKVIKTGDNGNASLVGLVDIGGEDSLTVPEGYYAVAQFGLQSQVLHGGSSVKLSCPPGKYKMPWSEVFRGLVSFFLPRGEEEAVDENGQPVKFQASSHTIVAAIKGTQFAINATPSGDKLYVFEGSVETRSRTNPNTPAVIVSAGQAVSGSESGLSSPIEAKVSEITALTSGVIQTLGGANDSISTIRLDDLAELESGRSLWGYIFAVIIIVLGVVYLYVKR